MTAHSSSTSTWSCTYCTFVNEDGKNDEANKCMICQESRGDAASDADAATTARERSGTDFPLDSSNKSVRFTEFMSSDKSVRFSEFMSSEGDVVMPSISGQDSMAALGNMSFAAWESDRKAWTCAACTFVNEPRFLMCGACGMAEGSIKIDDEVIAAGLQKLSLADAQCYLVKEVHEHLDGRRHDKLQHDRAAEVLKDQIKDAPKAENDSMPADVAEPEDTMKQGPNMERARKHIETLERIQKAENEEHVAMLLTIEEWRSALEEKPDKQQEKEVRTKEKLLHRQMQEWREREKELGGFRTRLEGNVSSV